MKYLKKFFKNLKIFYFDNNLPGMVYWFKNGYFIFKELKNYIYYILSKFHYHDVKTPLFISNNFLKISNHIDNFEKNIYKLGLSYIIKPLNCPNHILLFKNNNFIFNDIPVRFMEFGSCYRNEYSGGLFNLMRLREFTQDDGHIFCFYSQILKEGLLFHNLVLSVYGDFYFSNFFITLSLRPLFKLGLDYLWDVVENKLRSILIISNSKWKEIFGNGAFYGPKIEYNVKDNLGFFWQCGTLQLDIILPKLFNINIFNKFIFNKNIVILHRAILGSIERFIGILLNNNFNKLPFWISSIQIIILNTSLNYLLYCKYLYNFFKYRKIRVFFDNSLKNLNYKIDNYIYRLFIPYILKIGFHESNNNFISFKSRYVYNFVSINLKNFFVLLIRNFLLYL